MTWDSNNALLRALPSFSVCGDDTRKAFDFSFNSESHGPHEPIHLAINHRAWLFFPAWAKVASAVPVVSADLAERLSWRQLNWSLGVGVFHPLPEPFFSPPWASACQHNEHPASSLSKKKKKLSALCVCVNADLSLGLLNCWMLVASCCCVSVGKVNNRIRNI